MRPRYLFYVTCQIKAVPGRFVAIFYDQFKQSPSQIGAHIAIQSIVSVFSAPLFSHLADKSRSREKHLVYHVVSSLFFFLLLALAAPPLHIISSSFRFAFLLCASVLYGAVTTPLPVIVDAITVSFLKKTHGIGEQRLYGLERLWASVSWAVAAISIGALLDLPISHLSLFYAIYVAVAVQAVIVTYIYFCRSRQDRSQPSLQHDTETENQTLLHEHGMDRPSLTSVLKPFILEGGLSNLLFLNLIFWFFFGMSLSENLLLLYLTKELGASYLLCGLCVCFSAILEIPTFAMTPRLLQKFGADTLLIIATCMYAARTIAYAFLKGRVVYFALESVHGFAYPTLYASSVIVLSRRAPSGYEASALSLLAGLSGLGLFFGSLVGGWLMQMYGSCFMFISVGSCVFAAAGAYTMAVVFKWWYIGEADLHNVEWLSAECPKSGLFFAKKTYVGEEHHRYRPSLLSLLLISRLQNIPLSIFVTVVNTFLLA